MQFFVPGAMETSTADALWAITRKKLQATLDTSIWDRRIHALSFLIGTEQIRISIGEPYDGEEVLMIFEGKSLLICTAGHGMYRGKPIVIPKERAIAVEFFDC